MPLTRLFVICAVSALAPLAAYGQSNVAPDLDVLRSDASEIERLIKKGDAVSDEYAYERAALEVINILTPVIRAKADRGLGSDARDDLSFLMMLAKETLTRLRLIREGRVTSRLVPRPRLSRVTLERGAFFMNGDPILFVGPMGYGQLQAQLPSVSRLGFNIVGDDFNSYAAFHALKGPGDVDHTAIERLEMSWSRLSELNLAVAFNPTLHYFPVWALKRYPDITGGEPVDDLPDWSGQKRHAGLRTKTYGSFFPFSIDSPSLLPLVSEYYAALSKPLKSKPGVRLLWLMNEPTYRSRDETYVRKYREYLESKFDRISDLNASWRSAYSSFADVNPAEREDSPGRYDWLDYNQARLATWFGSLASEIKKRSPDTLLSNKPLDNNFLRPESSIDVEREANLWDVPGSDTHRSPNSRTFAYDWRPAIMLFDFQKAIAPNKPLADFEFHYSHEPRLSGKYVNAAFWHSFLHGLRLSTFWVWDTGNLGVSAAPTGMHFTALSQPRVTWATASTALDLRRLAKYVVAFPPKPEVGIYYSKAALFLDRAFYTNGLNLVYEATIGLDAPVGFVTDRMVMDDLLGGYKLIIIPSVRFADPEVLNKLRAFIARGGRVVIIGEAPLFDKYRKPLAKAASIASDSRQIPLMPSAFLVQQQLEDAYSAAAISRPFRLRLPDGQPAWPIDFRCSRVDGEDVCYIVGLNKDPMTVELQGANAAHGWIDLISGNRGTSFSFVVNPLDIRLMSLTPATSLRKQ